MPDVYAASPSVIETDLDHELILLDPETQEMFSLNETGRRVWRALPAGEEALVRAIVEAYQVSREAAQSDVRRLVHDLLDKGLIRVRADAAGG
jgi:hypothetical protein